MIPNIRQDKKIEEAIKKLWLEKVESGEMSASQLYKQFLGDYFDVANYRRGDKDWLFFVTLIRDWKKAIKRIKDKKDAEKRMEGLTDEEVEEVQSQNRRRMIVMLSDLLADYETLDGSVKKGFDISEIRRMYSSIQTLEEKMKMTDISRGKLKLEAVRTLLPYQRMSLPEILALKEKLNESFERIVKLKSGESVGADTPVNG